MACHLARVHADPAKLHAGQAGLYPEGVYPGKERRDFPYRVLRDPLTGTMS